MSVVSTSLLTATSITKSYGKLQILKGIDLQVVQGEIVAIMGASGAGKSTLLHILATLDKPDSGTLYLGQDDLISLRGNKLAAFRNQHIGFIFQSHNLLSEFTALENVCLPGYIGEFDERSVRDRAKELLVLLGLEARMQHKPTTLSGGEQQRVAVARALINNPRIVFADEPSGSLDSRNALALHELFFELRQKLEQTFVLATHNQLLADMADRKLYIQDGSLVSRDISSNL
ncbi:MAG: ABC transporter ATP-binding protein [Candidatus Amoebophilus sp.]